MEGKISRKRIKRRGRRKCPPSNDTKKIKKNSQIGRVPQKIIFKSKYKPCSDQTTAMHSLDIKGE